VDFFDIISNY